MVTKENFFEFAVRTNLVDWSTISDKVDKVRPQETPRKVGVTMNPRPPGLPRRRRVLCYGYVTWKQFKKVVNNEYIILSSD